MAKIYIYIVAIHSFLSSFRSLCLICAFFYSFSVFVCKNSWPELLGVDGDYAKAVLIEKQNPLVTAAIVPFHKVHLYVILNFQ